MRMLRHTFAALALIACSWSSMATCQESHSEFVARYLTDDVIGVVYFDFEKLDVRAAAETLAKLALLDEYETQQMLKGNEEFRAEIDKLVKLGVNRGYVFIRPTDLQYQGTSLVLPIKEGSNRQQATGQIVETFNKWFPSNPNRDRGFFKCFDRQGNDLFITSETAQLQRLQKIKDEKRDSRNLADGWSAVGNGGMGILLFGNNDIRRVLGQLVPSMPAPFDNITGQMIADELEWIGLELRMDDEPQIKVELSAKSNDSAEKFRSAVEQSMSMIGRLAVQQDILTQTDLDFVMESMKPEINTNRVSMSTEKMTSDLDRFAKVVGAPLRSVRLAAQQTQKMNNVRQLTLAMHNYESAYKHFPAQASFDDDGKPLLSWRVHLLPFLEQNELYQQFKLDEPWDSDHNIKLVERMPELYADPISGASEINAQGKTVYVVPAGEKLMFDGAKTISFRDILDGSSNTILIVSVAKANAVPWTKPVDWNVDFANPTKELAEEGLEHVILSYADGSTHRMRLSVDADNWRRLLQHEDGEIVENID